MAIPPWRMERASGVRVKMWPLDTRRKEEAVNAGLREAAGGVEIELQTFAEVLGNLGIMWRSNDRRRLNEGNTDFRDML